MKKILRLLIISSFICLMSSITIWADELAVYNSNQSSDKYESTLLTGDNNSLIKMINPRGLLVSQAIVGISNEGKGKIGVYSQVWTHVPVDYVFMKIYLDKWENDTWNLQQFFEVEFNQETYPSENMSMPYVSFDVTGYPTEEYYRLRCMYLVEDYSSGQREVISAQTNGVLITKTP